MEKEMNLNIDSFKDALEEKNNIPTEDLIEHVIENVGINKAEIK